MEMDDDVEGTARTEFDVVHDPRQDLPPPSDAVKAQIRRLIWLERLQNILGWLTVSLVLTIVGCFGGSLERTAFWVLMGIIVLDGVLKLTRHVIEEHFANGVPCCFIVLQSVEDPGRYHRYLAAVWLWRALGTSAQGALSGTLAWQIRFQQEALPQEEPSTTRLVELLYLSTGVVFVEILLSVLILFLNYLQTTRSSLLLGLRFIVSASAQSASRFWKARRRRRLGLLRRPARFGTGRAAKHMRITEEAEEKLRARTGAPPAEVQHGRRSASGGGYHVRRSRLSAELVPPGDSCRDRSESPPEEAQVLRDLSAFVWYLHRRKHPRLSAVCAYPADGEAACGLPGHWFLRADQLVCHAFRPAAADDESCGSWATIGAAAVLSPAASHSRELDLDQEMALDALARLAKSCDRDACELLIGRGAPLERLLVIVASHRSVRCRERAAAIIWHLSDVSAREARAGRAYDPFSSLPETESYLALVGLDMLNALATKSSPELQENAAGALASLCLNHGIIPRLFCGGKGKARIEQLVDVAAAAEGSAEPPTSAYALHVLARVSSPDRTCACSHNSKQLQAVKDFAELSDARSRTSSSLPSGSAHFCADRRERSWIASPRALFRESGALPKLIGLFLSRKCAAGSDAEAAIMEVLLSYQLLGGVHNNLYPFEVKEFTRLLRLPNEAAQARPAAAVFCVLAVCDMLFSYFAAGGGEPAERQQSRGVGAGVEIDLDIVPRLIDDDGRRFFIDLTDLSLSCWSKFINNLDCSLLAAAYVYESAPPADHEPPQGVPSGSAAGGEIVDDGESAEWAKFGRIFQSFGRPVPTVRWLYRSPARLLAHLLASHFELLTTEIDLVHEDDKHQHRSVAIGINQENSIVKTADLAAMTAVTFGLATLICKEESVRTKCNACTALTRLGQHRDGSLLPYLLEACKAAHHQGRLDSTGIKNEPEFRGLVKLLGIAGPRFGV